MDDNNRITRKRRIYKGGKLIEVREEVVDAPPQRAGWMAKVKNATKAAGRVIHAKAKGEIVR